MALLTELILVRHGEAHCNVAGIAGGAAGCTGLTERGRTQVGRLGRRLRGERIDAIYAGPRLRVQQTGDILANALEIPLQFEPDFAGPEHGSADGLSWQDIEEEFGGPPMAFPDRPYAPGSETWNGYRQRTAAAIGSVLERHESGRIIIAGHGETVMATHEFLLRLPFGSSAWVGFPVHNASLTRWELHRTRHGRALWQLTAHNDITHLVGQ
jgi:probable phosphoglycerate mutase